MDEHALLFVGDCGMSGVPYWHEGSKVHQERQSKSHQKLIFDSHALICTTTIQFFQWVIGRPIGPKPKVARSDHKNRPWEVKLPMLTLTGDFDCGGLRLMTFRFLTASIASGLRSFFFSLAIPQSSFYFVMFLLFQYIVSFPNLSNHFIPEVTFVAQFT